MKHRTDCFDLEAGVVADVNAFADRRMAEFGQVDSNLMLASGFKVHSTRVAPMRRAIGLMYVTERFASIGASPFGQRLSARPARISSELGAIWMSIASPRLAKRPFDCAAKSGRFCCLGTPLP
jgi:hypothetical protein